MFERFSDGSRRVILFVQEDCREMRHENVEVCHVFLALMREEDSATAQALAQLGLSYDQLKLSVSEKFPVSEEEPGQHIPFTIAAKKLLEQALREALKLRDNYIGTQHIFLAMVAQCDDVVVALLSEYGVDVNQFKQVVFESIGLRSSDSELRHRDTQNLPTQDDVGVDVVLSLLSDMIDGKSRSVAACSAQVEKLTEITGLIGKDSSEYDMEVVQEPLGALIDEWQTDRENLSEELQNLIMVRSWVARNAQ